MNVSAQIIAVMEYIFSSFWVWFGTLLLVGAIFAGPKIHIEHSKHQSKNK